MRRQQPIASHRDDLSAKAFHEVAEKQSFFNNAFRQQVADIPDDTMPLAEQVLRRQPAGLRLTTFETVLADTPALPAIYLSDMIFPL